MEKSQIQKAVEILKADGVIAYPTETVYGLGANIFSPIAVKKVFRLKGRNFNQPLSVAIANFQTLKTLAKISPKEEKLLHRLLPGPVTVILPKKKIVPNLVTAGQDTVGIRFPDHPLALAIINQAGFPITATSANLSGKKEITNPRHLQIKVDFVVKNGCRFCQPSTIVDLSQKRILRAGAEAAKVKEILKGFGK